MNPPTVLKTEIHQLIDNIEDEETLQILKQEIIGYTTSDILDELTPEQLKGLDEAIAQVDRGETISWKAFKRSTIRWKRNKRLRILKKI